MYARRLSASGARLLADRALSEVEARVARASPLSRETRLQRAFWLRDGGAREEALVAVASLDPDGGRPDPVAVRALHLRAQLRQAVGDPEGAELDFRAVVAARRPLGAGHPALRRAALGLARLLAARGDLDGAATSAAEALVPWRYPGLHADELRGAVARTAVRGQWDVVWWHESLGASLVHYGPRDDQTAGAARDLGIHLARAGEAGPVEALWRLAFAAWQAFPARAADAADVASGLGSLAMRRGDVASAERFHLEAVLRRAERFGPEGAATLRSWSRLVAAWRVASDLDAGAARLCARLGDGAWRAVEDGGGGARFVSIAEALADRSLGAGDHEAAAAVLRAGFAALRPHLDERSALEEADWRSRRLRERAPVGAAGEAAPDGVDPTLEPASSARPPPPSAPFGLLLLGWLAWGIWVSWWGG